MNVNYRKATEEDVPGIRIATRSAIEGIAAKDYSPEVINSWGKNSPESIEKHKLAIRTGKELTWVAELDKKIVGFSALCPEIEELRAVYVAKEVARQGVGTKLLEILESAARELSLTQLKMHSSITAKDFYEFHGYENLGAATHTLNSGVKMACFSMRKILRRD